MMHAGVGDAIYEVHYKLYKDMVSAEFGSNHDSGHGPQTLTRQYEGLIRWRRAVWLDVRTCSPFRHRVLAALRRRSVTVRKHSISIKHQKERHINGTTSSLSVGY